MHPSKKRSGPGQSLCRRDCRTLVKLGVDLIYGHIGIAGKEVIIALQDVDGIVLLIAFIATPGFLGVWYSHFGTDNSERYCLAVTVLFRY